MSILGGFHDIIERHLGVDGIGTRQPRYAHRSACQALSKTPPPGFDSASLIAEMLERMKANRAVGAVRTPSAENWRFNQQLRLAAHNHSPETTLEKTIAGVMDDTWANQVPTASGLVDSVSGRRRSIDLVHRIARGEFEFIELKVWSNTPLHAAMELMEYAVLYLFARLNVDARPTQKQELLEASVVHLRVLAPAAYYGNFCFDWLEEELTKGLTACITKNALDLAMDFTFSALPQKFNWSPSDATRCPDEAVVVAVKGRHQVHWPERSNR
jgi:hypothetical protein